MSLSPEQQDLLKISFSLYPKINVINCAIGKPDIFKIETFQLRDQVYYTQPLGDVRVLTELFISTNDQVLINKNSFSSYLSKYHQIRNLESNLFLDLKYDILNLETILSDINLKRFIVEDDVYVASPTGFKRKDFCG